MQEIKKINLSLEWKSCKIGDVVSVRRGSSPRPIKDYVSETGMPWVKIADATKDQTRFINFTSEFIKEEGIEKSVVVNPGDLIVSNSATPGLPKFMNIKACVHDGWLVFDSYNGILKDFLYYYFIVIRGRLVNQANGSVFKNLKTDIVRNFDINLPDLETQEKIVKILSQIDKKIETTIKINKNLEELAKAIYRHHFIDFKPYALGGLMKHSSQGMIPKDWSVQSIEEFVDDMKNGGTPKRGESDYWDNGTVPWLKTGEINNNIIIKSEEHITELGLKNSSAKLLPINSIIMALYGKGTAARIGLLKFEATTNQACCAMICNDFNKTLFLYLFLLFNQKEIENLASGSVQQNLSKDLIANLELVVPPIEIIDNLPFKEIFDTIANNYFEIEYLINLRDTLLPKLMSGEIDVSKINCDLKIIIRKIYIKSSKLFLWRYLSENKNYIKNTKSNETLLKSRTIYKINKFLAKFNARYRYYRQ